MCLLPFMLAGCFHKTQQVRVAPLAPPIVDTLPPKPEPVPTDLPPPVITIPGQNPAQAAQAQPQPAPKPPVKHRKHPATNTQLASGENPGVSAIGQLSTGDPSDLRQPAIDSIAATERGLRGINRQLSDQEQKTVAQIREFLKQARAALDSGDVYGASTLAAKAKVLLGELIR